MNPRYIGRGARPESVHLPRRLRFKKKLRPRPARDLRSQLSAQTRVRFDPFFPRSLTERTDLPKQPKGRADMRDVREEEGERDR